MNSSEKAALQTIQADLFKARTELNHERTCIDKANTHLRGAVRIVTNSNFTDAKKISELTQIIDDTMAELNDRYIESK